MHAGQLCLPSKVRNKLQELIDLRCHAGTTRRNSRISTAMAHDAQAGNEMPESTLADMARRSRSESSMSTWRRRALEFDGAASAQRGRLPHVL